MNNSSASNINHFKFTPSNHGPSTIVNGPSKYPPSTQQQPVHPELSNVPRVATRKCEIKAPPSLEKPEINPNPIRMLDESEEIPGHGDKISSKDIKSGKLNQKCYFGQQPDKLIECRHFSANYIRNMDEGNFSGWAKTSYAVKSGVVWGNIKSAKSHYLEMNPNIEDFYLKLQNKCSAVVCGGRFGAFLADSFQSMEDKGIDKGAFLIETPDHVMAAILTIDKTGDKPAYVCRYYDPENTLREKVVKYKNLNELRLDEQADEKFLDQKQWNDYFDHHTIARNGPDQSQGFYLMGGPFESSGELLLKPGFKNYIGYLEEMHADELAMVFGAAADCSNFELLHNIVESERFKSLTKDDKLIVLLGCKNTENGGNLASYLNSTDGKYIPVMSMIFDQLSKMEGLTPDELFNICAVKSEDNELAAVTAAKAGNIECVKAYGGILMSLVEKIKINPLKVHDQIMAPIVVALEQEGVKRFGPGYLERLQQERNPGGQA